MENDNISLTNLFQHLLSAELLCEWKIEFILSYLVRNFQICKEQTNSKVPSNILPLHIQYTSPIQGRYVLEFIRTS